MENYTYTSNTQTSIAQEIVEEVLNQNKMQHNLKNLAEICHLLGNKDVLIKEVVQRIKKDESLCIKVLGYANSPIYGFPQRISTVEQAVLILGINNLFSIISKCLVNFIVGENQWIDSVIKKHLLLTAMCAKNIAQKIYNIDSQQHLELEIIGLIHDIGKILILNSKYAKQYRDMLYRYYIQNSISFNILELENNLLKTNHVKVGIEILKKWNMPQKYVSIVENHHQNFEYISLPDDIKKDTAIIITANLFSNIKSFSYSYINQYPNIELIFKYLNIDITTLFGILQNIIRNYFIAE